MTTYTASTTNMQMTSSSHGENGAGFVSMSIDGGTPELRRTQDHGCFGWAKLLLLALLAAVCGTTGLLVTFKAYTITKKLKPAKDPKPTAHGAKFQLPDDVSRPIIVVGLGKSGTTSLDDYFKCGRLHTTHGGIALCVKENVEHGRSPLYKCASRENDVFTQFDSFKNCYFPQRRDLLAIHTEFPNATMVLNLRPTKHWVQSMTLNGHSSEMGKCHLEGWPHGVDDLAAFYNEQTDRVRKFVAAHPSHRLVEIEIEDPSAAGHLYNVFGIPQSCWHQANSMASHLGDAFNRFLLVAGIGPLCLLCACRMLYLAVHAYK